MLRTTNQLHVGDQFHVNLAWESAHGRCCCRQGKRYHLWKGWSRPQIRAMLSTEDWYLMMLAEISSSATSIIFNVYIIHMYIYTYIQIYLYIYIYLVEVERNRNPMFHPAYIPFPPCSLPYWNRHLRSPFLFSDAPMTHLTRHPAAGAPPILLLATDRW